jgi:hypothetical protein
MLRVVITGSFKLPGTAKDATAIQKSAGAINENLGG